MSERFESGYLNPTTNFGNSAAEINNFGSESHVAQQRRRDKLRIPTTTTTHHLQDIRNHLLQFPSSDSRVNPDIVQVRSSVRHCDLLEDQAMFSSEMLNFSMNSHNSLHQESGGDQSGKHVGPEDVSLSNLSNAVSSSVAVPPNPCYWKGIGSQQSNCDWIVNYVNQSGGISCNQNPLVVSSNYLKSVCNGYQDVQPSSASATSSQVCPKQFGELNFTSPSFYQNSLQEAVIPSTMGSQEYAMSSLVQPNNIRETNNCSWSAAGNELLLLPTYGNDQVNNASRLNDADSWMHRPVGGNNHQWNGEFGVGTNKSGRFVDTIVGDSTSRGLSLSLSSSPSSKYNIAHFGERFGSENLLSRSGAICSGSQDSKSIIDKGYGNSDQRVVGSSSYPRRSIGPLGPFTGYATILKNSKFLKPAQQLLDEMCSVTGSKLIKTCAISESSSREISISSNPINAENDGGGRGGNSGVSSSSFNSSNDVGGEHGLASGSSQTYRPEFQQKKAKLLYMQDEVCRRYKQYHQQMQMVASSFESVVGLSSATPYTSLALKTVSRHFRFLKNAISDQLRHISKALGEDLLSTNIGTSSKGEREIQRLRCIDQNFQKHKAGGDSLGFLEPQQPIWRPQRGLPERAVAVLRAWLFEHFLHPYPTDTDKHMLATQTGLSRNQVSNWFINARVRVWKPMVEEMHMLEANGSEETELNSGKDNQKPETSNVGHMDDRSSNKLNVDQMTDKQPECSSVEAAAVAAHAEVGGSSEHWTREKRSRIDCQVSGVDGGLMGFIPYHQGGLGAVSLTLGLRHSADQQQTQQQRQEQQEHQLRRHFGGHMIHDFVG